MLKITERQSVSQSVSHREVFYPYPNDCDYVVVEKFQTDGNSQPGPINIGDPLRVPPSV